MNEIFNHLWQSTVFAAAVAAACVALRRNAPRLRYWLWLAASLKFMIPFSLFVSMGARIQLPPDAPSLHAVTVQEISTYFAPLSVFPASVPARATLQWPAVLGAISFTGSMLLLLRWIRRWRMMHLTARGATRLPLGYAVPILSSRVMREPGVFGIFRPAILLPDTIRDNLTPEQLAAILAHELRHIRCRDNLSAALHMCVETLFWFNPAVWWIGARLMEERERDCDEHVMRLGTRAEDYARGIVHVCETYIESPLACASGISGSDLKNRIRGIMTWSGSAPVTSRGKVALAAAAIAVISAPFVIGVIRAQTLPPPPLYGYEVVSIRASDPGETRHAFNRGPQGGLRTTNTSVLEMLAFAYNVRAYQFVGAPGWVTSARYDVVLTPDRADPAPGPDPTLAAGLGSEGRSQQRLRAVLTDRFGLVLRVETREMPVYALVQARTGAKLSAHPAEGPKGVSMHQNGPGHLVAVDISVGFLADRFLSSELGRPVIDETGLSGEYDFKLDWSPDFDVSGGPPADGAGKLPEGESIFTALTSQLGLRLESKKGPVQVYVVEKIERPAEN